MTGKCIGLFRGTSKSGKSFRVATMVYDIPMDKGFGVRSEEVFLPQDANDPVVNRKYIWSYNRSGFCDTFAELK